MLLKTELTIFIIYIHVQVLQYFKIRAYINKSKVYLNQMIGYNSVLKRSTR